MKINRHDDAANRPSFDGLLLFADPEGSIRFCSETDTLQCLVHEDGIRHISQIPGLECSDCEDALRRFAPGRIHQVKVGRPARQLDLRVIRPLWGRDEAATRGLVLLFQQPPKERLHKEEMIHQHERTDTLLQGVFDAAKSPMLLADRSGRIMAANSRAQELLENGEVELTKCGLHDLLQDETQEDFRARLHDFRHASDEALHLELDAVSTAGGQFPAKLVLRKIVVQGEMLFDVLMLDQTETRRQRARLQERGQEVSELKTTVKQLVNCVEEEKTSHRQEMAENIQRSILPLLDKMAGEDDADSRREMQRMLRDKLVDIAGRPENLPDPYLMDLTPTEMQVCEYIQMGRGTKEIAEVMHSSFETVQTHRKNIREKLGLKGKKVTLFAFLKGREA